jgi:Fe2+ or Zn2+ uptake regulation protein
MCGKILDVGPIHSRVDQKVGKLSGYADIQHTFLFSGICPACQKKLKKQKKQ